MDSEQTFYVVTTHVLSRDGILGKAGEKVTAKWPMLPDTDDIADEDREEDL